MNFLSDEQRDLLTRDGKPIILTPDDIITLRLLRNAIANNLSREPGWKYLPEPMSHLETLERILKQVG